MRRPSQAVLFGACLAGGRGPEDSTEESGDYHPDTRCDETRGGLLWSLWSWERTAKGITVLCCGGVL